MSIKPYLQAIPSDSFTSLETTPNHTVFRYHSRRLILLNPSFLPFRTHGATVRTEHVEEGDPLPVASVLNTRNKAWEVGGNAEYFMAPIGSWKTSGMVLGPGPENVVASISADIDPKEEFLKSNAEKLKEQVSQISVISPRLRRAPCYWYLGYPFLSGTLRDDI